MFISIPFSMILALKIVADSADEKSLFTNRLFNPKDFKNFLEKFNKCLIFISLGFVKFSRLIANGILPERSLKVFLRIEEMDSSSRPELSKIFIILIVPPRRF